MKYRVMMAVMLALCLACACAAAQTLPGVEVFSPGLLRVSEMLGRGEQVRTAAQLSVNDLLYVRDVSLLQKMLDGTEFVYTGGGTLEAGEDTLTIERDGQELFTAGVVRNAQGAELTLNGQTFGLETDGLGAVFAGGDALAGLAILERAPLTEVCAFIEGLAAGDALPGGFTVVQGFAVERTMSDDGTRLTKIEISGSIAREGEKPWTVTGYLRQPAGRAPKDTFEITLAQDEDNTLTLIYSSTRKSTITRKDKAGTASVETTLRMEGKLAGSRITTRLTMRLANAWTADGETLQEKVTVSATLGHTDRTPGRRMQRLNDMSAKLRCELTLETSEAGNSVITLGEKTTLSAVFDGNTFLDVAMTGSTQVGGNSAEAVLAGAPVSQTEAITAALEEATLRMAKQMYALLDDDAREKIEAGL